MRVRAIIATLVLGMPLPAIGCPVCDTETGAAVRAGIFNADFLPTLLEVLAPFPVLGLILFIINRYLPD